ncbi:galactoside alpha-(1,2)-fucosyltransferase 2-like [Mytilus edulis]
MKQKLYLWMMKSRRKCIVIPWVACVVVLIFFVFQTNTNTFQFLEVLNYQFFMFNSNSTKTQSINQIGKTIPALSSKAFIKQVNYTSTTKGLQTSAIYPTLANLTHCLCPVEILGLGNRMFQFATHFAVARSKGMRLIISKHSELNRIFKLHDIDLWDNITICSKFTVRLEKQNCAYDKNLLNFNSSQNIRLFPCLQSYKYFDNYTTELRKQFTFRDQIPQEAENDLNQIIKRHNIGSRRDITLVGVHVRRTDWLNNPHGYNVATPQYMTKAVQYFKSKYQNVMFIVSSLDLPWTRANMPNNTKVEYLSNPQREVIVATLSLCNHTITTVGSFGWWIGWLTGGEVTYFKWPAVEGTDLRKQYSKDYSDYFYPNWIGL